VRKRSVWWESLTRSLDRPQLRRVLGAYLGFIVCEHAHWIALLVWAYDGGGVQGAGSMALVQLIPATVLASPAAALLSRLPRIRALTIGYVAQAGCYVVVGAAILLDLPVPVVVAAAVPMAVAVTLTRPVHHATLPEISLTAGDLTASNAASGSVEAAGTLMGPLACAAIISAFGPGGVVVFTGAVSAVSAWLTAPLSGASGAQARPAVSLPVARALGTVVGDPAARTLVGLAAVAYTLVGMIDILLVVLAIDLLHTGPSGPGLLTAAVGLGALAGASLTLVLVGRQRIATFLVAGGAVAGASFSLGGLAETIPTAVVLVAITGAGRLFFDVATRTFEQRLLPDRLLVALFGVQEAVMMAGMAFGAVLAPLLVQLLGPRAAFAGAALLPVVTALAWPRLRRYDAATTVPLDVVALLDRVPILTVLAPRVVERLASEAVPVLVDAGNAVVTEGEVGDRFYVIEAGRLVVAHGDAVVSELGEGGWFGELALLRDSPRTATVTATSDVRLLAIERDSFLSAVAGVAPAIDAVDTHARRHYR
jgi:hypothetical protein